MQLPATVKSVLCGRYTLAAALHPSSSSPFKAPSPAMELAGLSTPETKTRSKAARGKVEGGALPGDTLPTKFDDARTHRIVSLMLAQDFLRDRDPSSLDVHVVSRTLDFVAVSPRADPISSKEGSPERVKPKKRMQPGTNMKEASERSGDGHAKAQSRLIDRRKRLTAYDRCLNPEDWSLTHLSGSRSGDFHSGSPHQPWGSATHLVLEC